MNDDELGRLLSGAFDAEARAAVGDDVLPPAPRFALAEHLTPSGAGEHLPLTGGHHRADDRRRSWLARAALPLGAAASVVVLIGLVLALVGLGSGTSHPTRTAAPVGASTVHDPTSQNSTAHSSSTLAGHGKPVHIKLLNSDGSRVGVGMPVIAYLSRRITDGRALQDATSVTVDGKPMTADWYVERSAAEKGYPYEAHLRPQHYWPAHSRIHVGIATAGLTAGKGLVYDDSLTLDFRTAAQHIAVVDDTTHTLSLSVDGHHEGTYPVSLGASDTPTRRGIKVIMEKGASICMSGPGYSECHIKYTQRLTYDGEYLHSAPWNARNIEAGIDSSNGCTNLLPADAKKLFGLLRIGDVVTYPNADGPAMQLGNGYGDWDVPWAQWRTGGLVPTH